MAAHRVSVVLHSDRLPHLGCEGLLHTSSERQRVCPSAGGPLTCVGCCPAPSPALMMGTEAAAAARLAEPDWKWRSTMQSA